MVPSASDDVVIDNKMTVTINIAGAQCRNLRLGSGSTGDGTIGFSLSGISSLTVSGTITFGDVAGAKGTLNIASQATLTAGGIAEADADESGIFNTDEGTVVFTGTFTMPNNLNLFNNLTIQSGSITVGNQRLNLDGDLSIAPSATLDLKSAGAARTSPGGTLQISEGGALKIATDFPSNFNAHSIAAGSTVEYNAASGTQFVSALNSSQSYGNLVLNGSGLKRLSAGISVSGDLTVQSGIFDLRTFSANRTSTGGTLSILPGATLRISGTGTLPANFNTHSISSTSNIDFRGTNQQVPALNSSQNYGNLIISGSDTKTLNGDIAVVGTLSFLSESKLSIGANTLTINGNIDNGVSGGITGGNNSNLIFDGTAFSLVLSFDQTTPGTTNVLRNLTINSSTRTLSLGNAMRLTGTLSVQSGTLASNGNLTLASSATGTASLSRGASAGNYVTGDVTVERYISSGRKWHMLSVATDGTQSIKDAWQEGQPAGSAISTGYGTWITTNDPAALSLGFDFQSNTVSMKSYNPAANNWTATPNTTDLISTHQGYMIFIRGDRGCTSNNRNTSPTILRTTGPLKQGDQSAIAVAAGKNGAIGNPFASALDFSQLNKSASIDDYYYVWDPRLSGSQGLGAYQTFTFNGTGYTPTPGGGSYGTGETMLANFIQSGQAFIVHATGGTGTVQVLESAKASGSQLVSRPSRPAQLSSVIRTRLYTDSVSAGTLLDGTLLELDEMYSSEIDREDARKLTNTGESIGIRNGNEVFSVERRAAFQAADTVFFHLSGLRTRTYQLEISLKNLVSGNYIAVLQDRFTGSETTLSDLQPNVVTLAVTADAASRAADRLRIVLRPSGVLSVKFVRVGVTRENAGNRIDWEVAANRSTVRYSVERSADGQQFNEIISRQNESTTRYTATDPNPLSGTSYYRIKAYENTGALVLSQTVKVSKVRSAAAISIVPNPVINREMNVQFQELPAGDYSVRVFNTSGQTLLNNRFAHPGGTAVRKILLPEASGSGVLFAEIRSLDGFTQTIRFIAE